MMPTQLRSVALVLMSLALQCGCVLGCKREDGQSQSQPQATSEGADAAEVVAESAGGDSDDSGDEMDDSGDEGDDSDDDADDEGEKEVPGSSATGDAGRSSGGSASARSRPPHPTSGRAEDIGMWTFRWGTPDEVMEMLEEADLGGIDHPLTYGEDALTPLHLAICNPDLSVAEMLLKNGAMLEARDRNGNTPLLTAVSSNPNHAAVELLLKAGADARAVDGRGRSVLHDSQAYLLLGCLEMMLKVGADLNCRDWQGTTPLHIAAIRASPAEFRAMLKAGADPMVVDSRGVTILHAAARNRVDDTGAIVSMLIEAGCDMAARDASGWIPLHHAARFGGESAVEALLRSYQGKDGASVMGFALVNTATPSGYTPLHAAIENDDPKPAEFLVESLAAVNVTASGYGTPLQLALQLGRGPDYVDPLIKEGADVQPIDGKGRSLLHVAVERCPAETIRLLIDAGLPVDAETPDGFTPLHVAAQHTQDPRVIELLLKAGADPRGKRGPTPHSIARPEHRDILWKALMDSPLPSKSR